MGKEMTESRSLKRKHMRIRQVDKHMQTSLKGIAARAQNDPKHRFGNLYGLLNDTNLWSCFSGMNKKAAPGVDKVDYKKYEENLDENIGQLVDDLKGKRYKAKLVRRKNIPKDNGKVRALGIPAIGDKLLQTTGAKILSAIFEQDFKDFSHGYRRGKGPQKAALQLRDELLFRKYNFVVEADIKGFFDNLDHDWLIRMLETRIDDNQFINLIRKWLKAGILEEDGKVINPLTGTPQGGAISAVLANIYLHFALDLWFEKRVKPIARGAAMIIRFADDFVCCFQHREDASKFYEDLEGRLAKFNLTLAEDKTRMMFFSRMQTESSNTFCFLGFEYRWDKTRNGKAIVRTRTDRKKLCNAVRSMKEWIVEVRCTQNLSQIMTTLKSKLRGHYNYYGVRNNFDSIDVYYWKTWQIMFKWLNRRSQRKSYTVEGFKEMWAYFNVPSPRIRC
jgi:RNA-directed DNA polymerase